MRWKMAILALAVMASGALQAADLAVQAVELLGFRRVPVANIREAMPLRAGDPLDPQRIEAARSWLQERGLFLSVQAAEQGGKVTFTVSENPLVGAVLIENSAAPGISAPALRTRLQTKPRETLSTVMVGSDAQKMAAFYLERGQVVEVEAQFAPPPTSPDVPVNVQFVVTQLVAGRLVVDPLNYVKAAAVQPYLKLAAGTPLTVEAINEQQRELAAFPLFSGVDEPTYRRAPDLTGANVELVFPPTEADQPLLVAQTIDLVDVEKLRRWVRFSAVDMNVSVGDMEYYHTPDEAKTRYDQAAAKAQQSPDDGDAAWQAAYWAVLASSQIGPEAALKALDDAGSRLERIVKAGGQPIDQLRLAQVLSRINQPWDALNTAIGAIDANPPAALLPEMYAVLASSLANLATSNDPALAAETVKRLTAGATALSALPSPAGMDTITRVAQFYFVSLGLARLYPELRQVMRVDGPLARWLFSEIALQVGKLEAPAAAYDAAVTAADQAKVAAWTGEADKVAAATAAAQAAEALGGPNLLWRRDAQHLAKLVTAVAFVIRSMGYDVVGMEAVQLLPELLSTTQSGLSQANDLESQDPSLPFMLGLNHLLHGNTVEAQSLALQGLGGPHASERLVDLYVMSSLENIYSNLKHEDSLSELRNSVTKLAELVEQGTMASAGHALLVTKLQMALYQTLPVTDEAGRQTALDAVAKFAQVTIDRSPGSAGGYWFLGLSELKGPDPAQAVAPYRRVLELQPGNPEAQYALGLALIAAGNRQEGMALMDQLRPPAQPAADAPATTPRAPVQGPRPPA